MSVSVPLTSFFNDVKICVASYFMYGVSHEGKYCTKFLNQYSFICSKFYKLYKYNRFWGLKYIPRLFSEYMLTFRAEKPMKICVTN